MLRSSIIKMIPYLEILIVYLAILTLIPIDVYDGSLEIIVNVFAFFMGIGASKLIHRSIRGRSHESNSAG